MSETRPTPIRTSTTGEKCARCGDTPYRVDLTPGDGFCPACFRAKVREDLDAIKVELAALISYIDHEDPQHERLDDDTLAALGVAA